MGARIRDSRTLRLQSPGIKRLAANIGRRWATDTVNIARPRIRVASGRTRATLRVSSVDERRAEVSVRYIERFVEATTKAHVITARRKKALAFQGGGRTVFAKKVHRRRREGTPVLRPAGRAALRANPISPELLRLWNGS